MGRRSRGWTSCDGLVGATAVLLLVAAACGSSSPSADSNETVGGTITVFAAASLTDAFTTLKAQFETDRPGAMVRLNFGASSALAEQIERGAPADVLATADTKTMQALTMAGQVDTGHAFARNRMAILVGEGNPKGIRSVAYLDKPGVTYVVCAPEVPCGALAARILRKADVDANPASFEENVRAVVSRVTLGEADAGLVYTSDVQAASSKVDGVAIPDDQNAIATYPISVLKRSGNRATSQAFVDLVRSSAGQRVLARAGFLPAR